MQEILKRLEEIEVRAEKATPGPWKARGGIVETPTKCITKEAQGARYLIVSNDAYDGGIYWGGLRQEDAEFIAACREDVPWVCGLVRKLLAVAEAAREVVKWHGYEQQFSPFEQGMTIGMDRALTKLGQALAALEEGSDAS